MKYLFEKKRIFAFLLILFAGCQSKIENPFIKGPYLQKLQHTEMTIVWENDTTYSGTVHYGIGEELNLSAKTGGLSKVQKVVLTNLEIETEYSYQVEVNGFKSPKKTFRTSVKKGSPFTFAAYGDNKNGPFNHKRIADLILKYKPIFVANNGDLVDRGYVYKQWEKLFFTPAQEMISEIPLFPAVGNHEKNADYYYNYFCMPDKKAWFSYDVNGTHFVVINTEFLEEDGEQMEWLLNDLKNKNAEWTFVFQHVPPFTSGGNYYSRGRIKVKNVLHPIFEKYNVDLVITGHDHHYERSKPIVSRKGKHAVTYVVSGNGGTTMRYIGKRKEFSLVSARVFGFALIEIDGKKMNFKEISSDNEILDQFELDKSDPESVAEYMKNKIYFEDIHDPVLASKLYGKGKNLGKKDKFVEAITPLLEAYKVDKYCEEATALLAECYFELGDYKNAEKFSKITIDIAPLHPDSYEVMANIYKKKKNYKKAIEWYNKQLSVQPDVPDALADIADIYIKQGENDLAIEKFKKGIALLRNDWELHYELAQLYEGLGKKKEALFEYEKVIEWFSDDEEDGNHVLAIKKVKELSE